MSTVEGNQAAPAAAAAMPAAATENGDRPQPAASPLESGNIDKIREILFGGQMRDYERRFSRLEERLLREASDLREESRKRSEGLELYVRKEFEAMVSRLQAEQRTRDEAVQWLSREMHDLGQAWERKLSQANEEHGRAQSELRQQLLEQSKSLSDEIRQKCDELARLIDREVADVNHAKTDRSSLAALFTEVALRLNNEFRIPAE